MGGFCLLIFPVKGMISMAVLFAALGLNIIWPYQEKLGPIIFYRNRERNDRKKTLMHHQDIICHSTGSWS
jgi:hypothetical protein